MAGPWEKYGQPAPAAGPWSKYGPAASSPAAATAGAPPSAPAVANEYVVGISGPAVPGQPNLPVAQAAAATVAPEQSWGEYALDTATIMGEGTQRGIANIAGLPADILNASPMLANLLPGEQGVGPISANPVGGTADMRDILAAVADVGYSAMSGGGERPDAPVPQDALQRAAGRIGEEVGAIAVPGSAAVVAGRALGPEGARALGPVTRAFVEPAAVNPGAYLTKEATAAAAAGAGATTLNEMTGNQDRSNPWIDLAGAFGGVGLAGLANATIRSASDIGRALFGNGSYADEVVREAVMRKIADAAGIPAAPGAEPDMTPLIRAAEQGRRVADAVPGFTESLADRTGNPGLASMEYSRQGSTNAGSYTQRRAENSAAIDRALGSSEPQGTPGQFRGELENERTARLTQREAETANAQRDFDLATRDLAPVMTGEGRGAAIRNALTDASDAAKSILADAWRPIDEGDAMVDVGPLAREFGAADADVPRALQPNIPAASRVPGSFIDPETGTGEAALSEVMGVRSALTNDLRRQGITPQEKRLVEDRVSRLDSYLEQNMPPELRQQYADARAATVDYNDRFTRPQTAIGQTLRTREGQPASPDSAVAQRFVQDDQGRVSDFDALMRETGNDESVKAAVRDQILQDVRDRGLVDKPDALQDYLGRRSKVFERFPELREELGTAAGLRRKLDTAAQAETSLRDTLTKQGRSTVANYLTYGDENAGKAMRSVIGSRDPRAAADELLSFVGDDPKAVEGARKAFWDVLQEKSRAGGRTTANIDGEQPWSPRALDSFINDPANAAVAERLWRDNPEHLENIRGVAEALRGVDTRNAAKAPNTSGTQQGAFSQMLSPETLQSRFYAYQSGRVSGSFLITSIASVLVRRGVRRAQEEGFQKMLDDVLLNPDTAAILMRENNPANRAALARKAKLWFGNEASGIVNSMSEDDGDGNEAIMREGN